MKKIFAISVIAICVSLLASVTTAYFTDQGTARNIITAGAVGITVVEQQKTAEGLVEYPKEKIVVMPGTKVSKIVSVRADEASAYVRARYEIIIFDAEGEDMELDEQTITSIVGIDPDKEHWTEKSGWWYFHKALVGGEATEPLFTEVVFSGPEMTNEYQGCTVEIHIITEAVQAANNGNTVWEAEGWPEEGR